MKNPHKFTYSINDSKDNRSFISYEFRESNGVQFYVSEISVFEDDAIDGFPANGSTIYLGKNHSMNPTFLRKLADVIEAEMSLPIKTSNEN